MLLVLLKCVCAQVTEKISNRIAVVKIRWDRHDYFHTNDTFPQGWWRRNYSPFVGRKQKKLCRSYPADGTAHPTIPYISRFTVDCVWNVMAHAQKPDFVFRLNGRVHLNRQRASVQSTTGSRGVRFSGSNTGYTTLRGSVKGTGYPLHSPVSPSIPPPPRASPYAITFQLDST